MSEVNILKFPSISLFVGCAGSGKNNLFLNVLRFHNFSKIWIYSNDEKPMHNFIKSQSPENVNIGYSLEECEKHYNENKFENNHLVVFNMEYEQIKENSIIYDLFVRYRIKGISIIFMNFNYYTIPKTVRLQCQYIFIIKVSGVRDLKMILSEYNLNTTQEQLLKYYKDCCEEQKLSNFLLIDLNAPQNKTYRKNFTEYLK